MDMLDNFTGEKWCMVLPYQAISPWISISKAKKWKICISVYQNIIDTNVRPSVQQHKLEQSE